LSLRVGWIINGGWRDRHLLGGDGCRGLLGYRRNGSLHPPAALRLLQRAEAFIHTVEQFP